MEAEAVALAAVEERRLDELVAAALADAAAGEVTRRSTGERRLLRRLGFALSAEGEAGAIRATVRV